MSSLPIEDLKALIRDTIYDVLYKQYYLMPKIPFPKNDECKMYVDQMTEVHMVNPCESLQNVLSEYRNFPAGSNIPFDLKKFNSSTFRYCPFCGVKFK